MIVVYGKADTQRGRRVRYPDGRGTDRADIVDMLTMDPEARRKVVRMLGEIQAAR